MIFQTFLLYSITNEVVFLSLLPLQNIAFRFVALTFDLASCITVLIGLSEFNSLTASLIQYITVKSFMSKNVQKVNAANEHPKIKPSKEILEFIKLTNFVPAEVKLKGLIEFVEDLERETSELQTLSSNDFKITLQLGGFVDQWLEQFKTYPLLLDYLLERPDIHNLRFRFQDWAYIRNLINNLVKNSERFWLNPTSGGFIDIPSQLSFNNFGKIEITLNHILNEIIGFDLARFKRCMECGYVFWAYKRNKKYCSDHCKKNYLERSRRSDPRKAAIINEQRRNNRRRKKELEEMRKK